MSSFDLQADFYNSLTPADIENKELREKLANMEANILEHAKEVKRLCNEQLICDNCPLYNPNGFGSCNVEKPYKWTIEKEVKQ